MQQGMALLFQITPVSMFSSDAGFESVLDIG